MTLYLLRTNKYIDLALRVGVAATASQAKCTDLRKGVIALFEDR